MRGMLKVTGAICCFFGGNSGDVSQDFRGIRSQRRLILWRSGFGQLRGS